MRKRIRHYAPVIVAIGVLVCGSYGLHRQSNNSIKADPGWVRSPDPQTSCGPVSLSVVSHWLEKPISMREFTRVTGTADSGVCSLATLKEAMEEKGFSVEAVQLNTLYPIQEPHPMVIYTSDRHFLTAIPVDGDRLITLDPPNPPQLMDRSDLAEFWDGYALVIHVSGM